MADTKISALPSATTPLAGTEVLPIVQSTATVKVSIDNVTAGRTVSGAKFSPTAGTATGNGVYLPATNVMAFSTNGVEAARMNALQFSKFTNDGTYVGSTGNYHEMRTDVSGQIITLFSSKNAVSPYGIEIDYTALDPNGTVNSFFTCYGTTTLRAGIRSNGGLANFQANDVNLSDERVKTDIKPVGSYWDKIKAIEIVAFKYKDQTHSDDNIGVIAQQVEAVAPEFIDVDGFDEKNVPEDGVPLKTVYTTDMYHAAIKALQEAMARIEQLESKVASLEAK
jgi:hypothetical protein